MNIDLKARATPTEFSRIIGISRQAVSKQVKKGHITGATNADWLMSYADNLRKKASGRPENNEEIQYQSMREKRASADLKELELARIQETLINIDDLKPLLESALQHFRSELLSLSSRLKVKIDALYDIDLDAGIIEELHKQALRDFSQYTKDL